MRVYEGTALNEAGDEWSVTCDCGKEMEKRGFFDPEDKDTCPACKMEFRIRKIWFDESHYTGEK